jgi:uncharacterized protein (DUF1800 family)
VHFPRRSPGSPRDRGDHARVALDEKSAILRLARRAGFGAQAAGGSFDQALNTALNAAGTPAPPALAVLRPPGKDPVARKAARAQSQRLILWWLDTMITTPDPWLEKRTLLWHGHWATSVQKVRQPALMLAQNQTLRRLGGGDFGVLARAMVRDPALMIWLDAGGNTATAPNENLGRELMELFTLGVGNYTEEDVRQAALALTGWRVNRQTGAIRFVPRRHAQNTQTILGATADFTDQSLVDLLVSRPTSPRYLATRFWKWLVSAVPPSPAALDRLVTAYGAGRDSTALFRAMFTAPEFTDPGSVVVKQPVEWLAGAMRALGVRPSDLPRPQALVGGLNALGQVPFTPPSVGGWPTGAAWLTTSAAQTRTRIAELLVLHSEVQATPATVGDLLGVPAWTPRTQAVLRRAGPERLLVAALCAPEYVVNG